MTTTTCTRCGNTYQSVAPELAEFFGTPASAEHVCDDCARAEVTARHRAELAELPHYIVVRGDGRIIRTTDRAAAVELMRVAQRDGDRLASVTTPGMDPRTEGPAVAEDAHYAIGLTEAEIL